jgi:hypothetical protein
MPPRNQPKKKRSGRKLLFFVVAVVALAFGWVHIVHGSSGKSKPKHTTTVTCTKPSKHQKKACHRVAAAATHGRTRPSAIHVYATHLTAVLGRTRSAFDGASAAVQSTDLGSLDATCGDYGSRITILASEADGVPHPGPWYQPVSKLHHSLLGIYHDMQGALQVCQTASQNADDGAAATARDDIATADQQMRSMDDYVVWLSRQR